jgi:PST family polysaccharide transporter
VFADDLIIIVLGPNWQDAVSIFRLLTPTILFFAMINPLGWLLFSTGLVNRSLKIALVIAPVVITAYVIGLPYGPNGIASAYSISMMLLTVPVIVWAIKGTTISLRDILHAVSPPFISVAVAAGVFFLVKFLVGTPPSAFLRLGLGASVLFATYLWMLLYAMGQKAFYSELLGQLRRSSTPGPKESDIT